MSFRGPTLRRMPIEIATNTEIRNRVGAGFFARPDRPSFAILMLVDDGTGYHTVDFRQVRLVPGRMLRVEPNQVQTWDFTGDANVTIVMSAAVPKYAPN